MIFDLFENYNLETKHYVILIVLGIVEVVLFAMMFYNCYSEYKKRRKERIYMYQNVPKVEDEKDKPKPSLMEIFSVDMTLRRDSQYHNNNHLHPHRHHQQEHLQIHHTL